EAWILLDTPGDGREPAYAGIGFQPGVTRDWFADAVRRHDNQAIRRTLHRTEVHPGEVYVAHAGVPHYLGPRLSFIEVQEPSDHIVIPETSGQDDQGATMGLGWDLALDMIDYGTADAAATLARARQRPRVLRTSGESREVRLFADDVTEFFDATVLEVADEIEQMGKATIRPHYKTHKSPDLARRQLQAGAGGLSMATVWEAAVLAAAGMDDLFVVNTVSHPAKLRTLAELARDHRILVAV